MKFIKWSSVREFFYGWDFTQFVTFAACLMLAFVAGCVVASRYTGGVL